VVEWFFALRYRGQTRELSIEVDNRSAESLDATVRARIAAAFHAKHEEEYTFSAPGEPIQLVTVRCEVTLPKRAHGGQLSAMNGHDATAPRERREVEAHFTTTGIHSQPYRAIVLERDSLGTGETIEGPAIVLDVGSTILLPPGSRGRIDSYGNVIVEWRRQ
jgi:N-methylhydantoinase A